MSDGTMIPYVIRSGEYLAQIAHRLGFDCDAVWNDPKNSELRAKRNGNHNMLCAGDVVFVPKAAPPGLPFARRTTNRFVAQVPTTSLDLHFDGPQGPLANAQYAYTVEGVVQQGTTDASGKATFVVPVYSSEVSIVFADRGMRRTIKVGHLDPIDEPSGVWQRLSNRGHLGEPSGDEDADAKRLAKAITAFQTEQKLNVTGTMDDATLARLRTVSKS